MYTCMHMIFHSLWLAYARSYLSIAIKRFTPLLCVLLPLCVSTDPIQYLKYCEDQSQNSNCIHSALQVGELKESPWPPLLWTKPWEHSFLVPLTLTTCSQFGGHVYVGPADWFQIGKGVRQGRILSPCLFNFYAEYIMRNAQLEEAQAGIKIARRNINNLRNADDTTLMAESEGELKSLLMKVKEQSEKVGLKLRTQKTKIMASGPITSWEIDGETVETVSDFIFGGLQNHCRWWLQPWN